MLKRKALKELKNILLTARPPYNVIILEGARQVGKSTLLTSLREEIREIEIIETNFEENKILYKKIDDTKSFKDFTLLLTKELNLDLNKRQILIIDEAQESSELGSYLRFMKEQWLNTSVILSGSSMTRLFKKEQRIPVGRYISYKLYPYNFLEFLEALKEDTLLDLIHTFDISKNISELFHKELLSAYDRYLTIGGLPAVVNSYHQQQDYKLLRQHILISQEEDFIRKTEDKFSYLFIQALRGLANNLGFPSKYSHVGENTAQAKEVLGFLRKWHIVFEIEQKGINSTTNFHPKRYIYDLGIAQDIRNMPFPKLSIINTLNLALRTQLGGLIENSVLLNLLPYKIGNIKLSSWKKSSGDSAEVDFIWQHDYPIPIECKAASRVTNRNFSSLVAYLQQAEQKLGILVSTDKYKEFKVNGLRLINLPVYLCEPNFILNTIRS